MSDLFEKASRKKYRFEAGRGLISVEDLWDLQLVHSNSSVWDLNKIAISLDDQIQSLARKSFVKSQKSDPKTDELTCMLDIVKHIIDVKQTEDEERKNKASKAMQKKQEREVILAALEAKRTKAILSLTEEELLKRLEADED